ncbi:MAG: methyltransferase [Patescibacteria group bacterium]|nr:methyltransferase [Patescibacteria group bacterium]
MFTNPQEDYARGFVPFLDCTIFLDSRPLIPRIETEYWVECAIAEMRARFPDNGVVRVLDLFAGSGAIGVAVLKHLAGARADFGEIDAIHLPTIKKNIRENGIALERTCVIKTDVWSAVGGVYDAVLANPPYLAESRRGHIQESVLAEEPAQALFADEDGLALIRTTIEGAKAHLTPGGVLYIEHDPEQAGAIERIGKENGLSIETQKDQFGVLRYSTIRVA